MKSPPPGAALMPWSYSKLSTFEDCPLKAKFQYIDKVKVPEKEVFEKGNRIHEVLDRYVQGVPLVTKTTVKKVFKNNKAVLTPKAEKEVDRLKKAKKEKRAVVETEEKWGFNRLWSPTASWFASDIYCRMVVDVSMVAGDVYEVIDHKTGRMYPSHVDQGELYAFGAMNRLLLLGAEKTVKNILVKFIYLEHNAIEEKKYPVSSRDELQEKWVARANAMEQASEFPAKPNDKCKWCEFKALCPEKK